MRGGQWSRHTALGVVLAMLAGPLAAQGRDTLTVFAAADLAHVLETLGPRFQQQTGTTVVTVVGASGNLAAQIERGAPADVFFSANTAFVDRLITAGVLVPGTRTLYARGRLALAWPRAGRGLGGLADLLRPEVKRVAIANPETAPYGMAAKQALIARGIWDALRPKLVIGENVRQTLQYAQTGAVEAALVAQSVVAVPEVAWVPVDAALHAPIDQAAAVVARSAHGRAAAEFIGFVTGEGWAVMEQNGFARPAAP